MLNNTIFVKGKKYTIAKFNLKGFLTAETFVLDSVSVRVVISKERITFVKKGQYNWKSDQYIHINEGEQYMIWQGEHTINTSVVAKIETFNVENGVCAEQFRWPYFSPRYLHRARSKCKVPPIAFHINQDQGEELLTYQCASTKNN